MTGKTPRKRLESRKIDAAGADCGAIIQPTTSIPVMSLINEIPKVGYCRLCQIIGSKKSKPPIPAVLPISRTTWYEGIKAGKFPKPLIVGRCAMWRWADIRKLLEDMDEGKWQG